MKNILVYCSASNSLSPLFYSEMRMLGQALAESSFRLVFGGGKDGLMGALVDSHVKNGGEAIGVFPKYFDKPEIIYENLTERIVTTDMIERKKKMLELCDGVIASPGGLGTFDEASEVIALKQLGECNMPIVLHNFLGYWETYISLMKEMKEQNMISQKLDDMFRVSPDHKGAIEILEGAFSGT